MYFCLYDKKNITRRLEDMNFIFSWQKQIFYSIAVLVRKILFCKIKFVFSRHCVISSIYLKRTRIYLSKKVNFSWILPFLVIKKISWTLLSDVKSNPNDGNF